MGRQVEATTQRLRRLARALIQDAESADALVLATLSIHEAHFASFAQMMTTLIGLRRKRDDSAHRFAQPARGTTGGPAEIARAFEHLPLADREVLALVAVEHLAYEEAAIVLGISFADFIARLTRARASLARVVDGDHHVVLRVVK